MCGIPGWVSLGLDLNREQPTLDEMTETMACREPAVPGIDQRDGFDALGHRRVAGHVAQVHEQCRVATLPFGDQVGTYRA
jgi:asparagine synthetase B (glutamine-hydrolysing)